MTTSLENYRPRTPELAWAGRALCSAQSARIFVTDILPILARHWPRQRIRAAVRRLNFLTPAELQQIERWLRSRGF
ncbi:hypothetical protein ACFTSF_37685 [Kribbella sp. NPDC056951]|uniref:hypothetical protein n=1 Tax=Kribbella sp. NPDC056951 TaxID=3345978 RepID=UPI00363E76B7